jgi:SAM-dependent methyltransferase
MKTKMTTKTLLIVRKSIFYPVFKYFKSFSENHYKRKKNDKVFLTEYHAFQELSKTANIRFKLSWDNRYPCMDERTEYTSFDRHYVLHPAWAARILSKLKPDIHYDISSTLYFGSIVSAFIKFKFYDYRPARLKISDFESSHADLLNLPFESNSVQSLSCMHTLEHIGLGRYGDKLDYDGDLKAINELKRVLVRNGNLLVVVPIAAESRIYFNAHRVYSADQFISYFSGLELVEFCLIPDKESYEDFIINPSEEILAQSKYDCGCFWFKKN